MTDTCGCGFLREDAPAPESRPTSRHSSRHSSLRSVMGYRTHHGMSYSSVRNHQPNGSVSGHSAVYTGGVNGGAQPGAPLTYDHKYGYPV